MVFVHPKSAQRVYRNFHFKSQYGYLLRLHGKITEPILMWYLQT